MLDPRWVEAVCVGAGTCGYVFKAVIWEIVREGRIRNGTLQPTAADTRTPGIPLRAQQVVDLLSLSQTMQKMVDSQDELQRAISSLTTVIEERLPRRR